MFIATPQDDCESPWTKSMPTPLILNRLIVLAKEAHKVFEAQLTYPSDDFDYKVSNMNFVFEYIIVTSIIKNEL